MPTINTPGSIYDGETIAKASAHREELVGRAVTPESAKARGFKAVTGDFCVYRYEQCRLLQRAIDGMGAAEVLLVLKERQGRHGGQRISVWRKR